MLPIASLASQKESRFDLRDDSDLEKDGRAGGELAI
jgi:hypothetical protein